MAQPARRERPARRQRPTHVTDIRALRGPDGSLDGDTRALLLAAPRDEHFEDRRARVQAILSGVEKHSDLTARRALAQALYHLVRQLHEHRADEGARASARAAAKLEQYVSPDQAIDYLDALIASYGHVDSIWEPLERARAALVAFSKNPKPRPWRYGSGARRARRGNPTARLARVASGHLDSWLDEDETSELLRLVALLPPAR